MEIGVVTSKFTVIEYQLFVHRTAALHPSRDGHLSQSPYLPKMLVERVDSETLKFKPPAGFEPGAVWSGVQCANLSTTALS